MTRKRILISGGGSGFGELAAIGLARAGHDTIVGAQIWSQVTQLRQKVETLTLKNLRVETLDILDPYDIDNALNGDDSERTTSIGSKRSFRTRQCSTRSLLLTNRDRDRLVERVHPAQTEALHLVVDRHHFSSACQPGKARANDVRRSTTRTGDRRSRLNEIAVTDPTTFR